MALLGDNDDMFPLARGVSGSLHSPTISKLDILDSGMEVKDGFNSESHARTHLNSACGWSSLMVHKR